MPRRVAPALNWKWLASPVAQAGYLLVVTALLLRAFSDWSYDDPFITFRYADNLRQGLGFVYNPGARVLSTTTPLFSLLLAGVGTVWSDLPRAANLIGAFSLALGALFLWDLARTENQPLVGWAGLLLYPTFPLLVSTLGSEIPFYLMLCFASCAFVARRSFRAAACGAALAVLTRPEAAILVVILVWRAFVYPRARPPWAALLLFAGLTLPWLVFAWTYFGSPLPTSFFAKQYQGSMLAGTPFISGFVLFVQGYGARWEYVLEGLLFLIGLISLIRGPRLLACFVAWGALYIATLMALGVTGYFWYYATLVPLLVWAIGCGLELVSGRHAPERRVVSQGEDTEIGHSPRLLLPFILKASQFALVPIMLFVLTSAQTSNLQELSQHPDARVRIYRAVGEWLKANTPAGSTVGALEVGIVGYYAERPMVDFAGLLQPELTNQLVANSSFEDTAFWAIERYHPEYLVLHDASFSRLEESYVWQRCWPAQYFPGSAFGYEKDLIVYTCPKLAGGGD